MDMIERIKRGICCAVEQKEDCPLCPPPMNCRYSDDFEPLARAALEALREPSEEMVRAMKVLEHSPVQAWQAAIDAALKEQDT